MNVIDELNRLKKQVFYLERRRNASAPVTGYGFLGQAVAIWTGTGLVFDVIYPAYFIGGLLYPEGAGQVTLDASDPSDDRLDVIAVDYTGAIFITGTAAADPVKATVDYLTQLEITTVLIQAGATTPDITDLDVYKENVEFVGSSNISGADFADTLNPFAGTYCVDIDSFTSSQYVQFVDGSTHEIADYGTLLFYVRLKAAFSVNTGFIISFKNGSTTISSEFTLTRGVYQFDNTDVSGYQLIAIPLSEFTFSSSEFDTVYFKMKGANSSGFKLDNVIIQGGLTGTSNLQNTLTQIVGYESNSSIIASTPNSVFTFKGGDGLAVGVSATNELRFTQLPILAPTGTDTYLVNYPSLRQTYTTGLTYKLRVANTNTGASTLKINAYVTVPLVKNVSDALVAGDLLAGRYYIIVFDGTNFQVLNIAGSGSGSGTVNSGAQYRIPYYSTNPTGTVLDAQSAITASKIVTSDANGLLVGSYTFRDEDDMTSNDATGIPSQQSVKAYVDGAGGVNQDMLELSYTTSNFLYTQR